MALDDMRAISVLSPEYIKKHSTLFKEVSMVFVDANLSRDVLRTIVTLTYKARIPLCANPASTSLAHRLCDFLPNLALITPNSAEAGILWGQSFNTSNRKQALDAAKFLVNKGVDIAIVTLAKLGLCYATSETSGYIPAIHTKVLDPTGAGDALSAAVIFALLNGIPIDDAVRLGVSAASLTLGYPGTVMADLSLEKLYDHLVI
jgi:pseudouridine kinase